jgi:pimeloyl-ACP methyl ester carboxylesterase
VAPRHDGRRQGALRLHQGVLGDDFTEDLKAIDVPVLILHGDDDQIVPIADSARLRRSWSRTARSRCTRAAARHVHDAPDVDQQRSARFHQGMTGPAYFRRIPPPRRARGASTRSSSAKWAPSLELDTH